MNIVDFFYKIRNWWMVFYDSENRKAVEKVMNKWVPYYFRICDSRSLPSRRQGRKLIVSLTTIPERIGQVWIPIECMFRQTYKPDKILLWLDRDRFQDVVLPKELQRLLNKGLEIKWCKDVGVHTKYYYVLQEYRHDVVITIDDDVFYKSDTIEKLLQTYRKHKNCICAHWVREIKFSNRNNIVYDKFPCFLLEKVQLEPSHNYIALGVGGVLYPPNCLDKRTFEIKCAKSLSENADDIWLKAMEIISGLKVAKVDGKFAPNVLVENTQEVSLNSKNVHKNVNAIYIGNVFDKYELWDMLE